MPVIFDYVQLFDCREQLACRIIKRSTQVLARVTVLVFTFNQVR